MIRSHHSFRFLTAAVLCWLALAVTGRADEPAPPRVAVSIAPIHALVAEVMAGAASPDLLIDAGVSPHGFALKPSQAAALARADLVFWVGGGFEGPLRTAIPALAPQARVITLVERPELIRRAPRRAVAHDAADRVASGAASGADPHVWLDPENAIAILRLAAVELAAADPGRTPLYAANAETAAQRLGRLQDTLAARLTPVRHQPFVVVHDAYQYLEARYALRNLGALKGAGDEGRQVRQISLLSRQAQNAGVRCIFAEQQFDGGGGHGLDRVNNLDLVVLDPLGNGLTAGSGLYDAMMLRLVEAVAQCLGQ